MNSVTCSICKRDFHVNFHFWAGVFTQMCQMSKWFSTNPFKIITKVRYIWTHVITHRESASISLMGQML